MYYCGQSRAFFKSMNLYKVVCYTYITYNSKKSTPRVPIHKQLYAKKYWSHLNNQINPPLQEKTFVEGKPP